MRLVIVTGMSGAGKSTVLKMLEDEGYFCVDNLPIPLLPKFTELCWHQENMMSKIALGIDIRNVSLLEHLSEFLDQIEEEGHPYEILFLESRDETLIKRYKETRRNHPLAKGGRIENAIQEERKKLQFIKEKANYILDTSQLLVRELKSQIKDIYVDNKEYYNFYITLLSFGFKYGIPSDADIVMDVRFLPNPYYLEELRPLTGNDQIVFDYVMAAEESKIFLDKFFDMMKFLIPNYIAEGKTQLVVGIGCTGGKHRSVTITNAMYEKLKVLNYGIKAEHRDIDRH